ncbi:hypothetical protein BGZ65_012620 [Modicella reniformis]|uniref:PH domain-containing protein n=1 Tax=Modicella reniformis TaxID=1440133 RepID=A0A9P6SUM6_9FUNG|nr:hypothetical protein BGZ65_012620 [Modicella reniformis]
MLLHTDPNTNTDTQQLLVVSPILNDKMILDIDPNTNTDTQRLLIVSPIPNGTTTSTQRSPMSSDDDSVNLRAPLSVTCANKDQSGKFVWIDDDHPLKKENLSTSPKFVIANKLFHLRHGFRKDEFEQVILDDDISLDAIQELKLIQQPLTANFEFFVEQLQVMKTAAVATQFNHLVLLEGVVDKCARILERHQIFEQILELGPSQSEAIKALHGLVKASYKDTQELIDDWALLYHTLQEFVEHINSLTATTACAGDGAFSSKTNGKSPKLRRSLFSRKSTETCQIQISSKVYQYKRDVCDNWAAQMKSFEHLTQAYRTFADKTTEFALIKEVEALNWYCENFCSTFEQAKVEFMNTKQLSQLHYQIDYANFYKLLPKENALTTAKERQACPLRPLFTRDGNIVMVCFYNKTSYILQAANSEERDAWVECARQLNIEQPKPTDARREQDENEELKRCASEASFSISGKFKGNKFSLLKRLKSLRRSTISLSDGVGPTSEIDPDQLTRTEEEENARRMELGQPSLWEVRRLPLDLGVIPPLEHPIPFRRSHLYDDTVRIVDLTTGKTAPGEFGMGIEDRAAYSRDECALFAVLRPARLIPYNEIDRQRDDFFLCCKRLHKGEVMYVEPPYITDFYARSWLHPDMHIEFDPESRSVMIAKMYRIICSTSEIVTEFQKYHGWLMKNAKISPDNTFLCMDYRSHPLRIAKRIERAAVGATSASTCIAGSHPTGSTTSLASTETVVEVTDSKDLEAGRKYTELGECNIEFRRMSNALDALSVGFYNPATKRDMAVGVMVFDKSKVKATASSLGLNALSALGPSNGVNRVSRTEISLTLWQTDARTRPTFIKGRRVFETVKSKSLDVFKITGQCEALDELEDFMRDKSGTNCKVRDIKETFALIMVAFQDDVLDALEEDDEEERPGEAGCEGDGEEEKKEEEDRREAREGGPGGKGKDSEVEAPSEATDMLEKETQVKREDASPTSPLQNPPIVEPANNMFGVRMDGHLETVLEEDENEDNVEANSPGEAADPDGQDAATADTVANSTGTFRFKSRSALFGMDKNRQEQQQLQQQQQQQQQQQNEIAAVKADADATTASKTEGLQLPPISPSSFENLTADEELSGYLDTKSNSIEDQGGVDATASSSSVTSLMQLWASTASSVVQGLFSTSTSPISPPSTASALSSSPATSPTSYDTPASSTFSTCTDPSTIKNPDSEEKVARVTFDEARITVKPAPPHSSFILPSPEDTEVGVNDSGIVQATRYLSKKVHHADGGILPQEKNGDIEPGVDMEHHMPVKDLRKRWEQIYRMGI